MADEGCFYCTKSQKLHELMIEVAPLQVSTLYLMREQTYRGRCVVAYRNHAKDFHDVAAPDIPLLAADLARASRAVATVFRPDKINYASFGDLLPHVHFHLVPKYVGGPNWGGAFEITPKEKVFVSAEEYQRMIAALRGGLGA
jgi:diadenosine tetraphosphate (Ap4A) HIT family hydrolase